VNPWGHLAARFENPDRPHRLLAIDGGGIRGVLALEILAKMEAQLREIRNDPELLLCDFFDYIGGTSTGAIIAAGLARGMTVERILRLYLELSRKVFRRLSWIQRLSGGLGHKYSRRKITRFLRCAFGPDTDLFPEHLRCVLLVVTHNATTDSPWPISSNPYARYNDTQDADCNLRIPLWQLVRASTAAPLFFPPEVIRLDPHNPRNAYVFEDGGVTPYNNPAFLLYRMATLPEYRLCWPEGEDRLMLVSVGTGMAPNLGPRVHRPKSNAVKLVRRLIKTFSYGVQVEQDISCRTWGRCLQGDRIDWEIGDLITRDACSRVLPLSQDLGRHFLYARYNAELTQPGLRSLGLSCSATAAAALRSIDAIDQIDTLRTIGRAVAEQVDLRAFGQLVTGPLEPGSPPREG